MVSPNLIKRTEEERAVEINEDAKRLFRIIYSEQNKEERDDDNIPRLKVSTLISRLSFFYEKVRNAVDYGEDHLLRKNAINRILRRQIMIEGVVKGADGLTLAKQLLIELIRGSYLPNNKIPESKIQEIGALLEKYILLKEKFVAKINADLNLRTDINTAKDLINSKNKFVHWLLTLAACEIEENLSPDPVKRVLVNNLLSFLSKDIKLPADLPYEADLKIQIYLSINRNFLKFDAAMLSFVLFKYYNKNWLEIGQAGKISEEERGVIQKIAAGLEELKNVIDEQLAHPLTKQLDRIVRVYSLCSSILAETIAGNPTKTYNELQKGEKGFIASVRKVCEQKYQAAKNRLWRAATRSIIYIFLTKSIFVILIEIPAIKWFGEPLNPISLLINIAFPAVLLFFIVSLTRKPNKDNTERIINGLKEITFSGQEKKQPIVLRRPARRNWFKNGIFNLVYVASFCVSVYFIVWALDKVNFNWVSIIIFLFFLAFVSFFSVITTRGVKELVIVERKENLLVFLLDLFYMPIILVGRWLSREFSKINIFIFLFDFIIEAPFKVLVEIGEDWARYVRERRDNLDG
ncbi:TPA: hypothetical protein DCZ15_01000 [Candidatus Falkowbacteria bacterium]|nr:MAG: hypothetical protein UV95_C0003G0062 [Candidatus Falkowbacteria bacterium GW2011_GWF2_43_32]HBA36433.1 hypothetical protein [Candidatus Falkowbacteria bacterium]